MTREVEVRRREAGEWDEGEVKGARSMVGIWEGILSAASMFVNFDFKRGDESRRGVAGAHRRYL